VKQLMKAYAIFKGRTYEAFSIAHYHSVR
jgi:hypothetical protein